MSRLQGRLVDPMIFFPEASKPVEEFGPVQQMKEVMSKAEDLHASLRSTDKKSAERFRRWWNLEARRMNVKLKQNLCSITL